MMTPTKFASLACPQTLAAALEPVTQNSCAVDGCEHRALKKGYCETHYRRNRVHGSPLGGATARNVTPKLIAAAMLYDGDDCLIWPLKLPKNGYPRVRVDGKHWLVSVRICTLAHGPKPTPKHEAAHSCGNGHLGCIAKNHLRWATHAENMADAVLHGSFKGERAAKSKLTADQVIAIRAAKSVSTARSLGELYGVHLRSIQSIWYGQTWTHLFQDEEFGK